MYTATMEYQFRPDELAKGCQIWQETVLEAARKRKGFVRMQLFSQASGNVLALGTWKAKSDAEAFMQTGVFITLKERLAPLMLKEPQQRLWNLEVFADASSVSQ